MAGRLCRPVKLCAAATSQSRSHHTHQRCPSAPQAQTKPCRRSHLSQQDLRSSCRLVLARHAPRKLQEHLAPARQRR
eukprot:scaffold226176_cov33-Tisochrysis_lutea.AAC.2